MPEIPDDPNLPDEAKYIPDYLIDVETIVKNTKIEDNSVGLDFFTTVLTTDDAFFRIDETVWNVLYPQLGGSLRLALRKGTTETIHLPFAITYSDKLNGNFTNDMLFENDYYQLVLTKYPVDQRIAVHIENKKS